MVSAYYKVDLNLLIDAKGSIILLNDGRLCQNGLMLISNYD